MENYSGVVTSTIDDDQMIDYLPPGFRFHPTDEELITHYLSPKVLDTNFHAIAIGQVDFNKVEPWELPSQAKWGEKEWYFFCLKDRKYPTGLRTNRATEAGYWKATGKDKEIYRAKVLVGMKKTLVFYLGRAPKGKKSNWVMHEYRLDGKLPKYNQPKNDKNEWVISRVFEKNSVAKKPEDTRSITPEELHSPYLPPLMDFSPYDSETTNVTTNANSSNVTCFSNTLMLDQQNAYASNANANSSHMLNDDPGIMSEYQFVDSFFEQEQSMFRVLVDGKGGIKEELSQDIVHNSSVSDGFDQCLWTY